MTDSRMIALAFQDRIAANDIDGALELATDDAVFIGPDGTLNDKSGMKALFASVAPMIAGPFEQTITGVTTEGERVAIQMLGSALLTNGKTYKNRYHFLFIVRDGKIVEMTEYCDVNATQAFSG